MQLLLEIIFYEMVSNLCAKDVLKNDSVQLLIASRLPRGGSEKPPVPLPWIHIKANLIYI